MADQGKGPGERIKAREIIVLFTIRHLREEVAEREEAQIKISPDKNQLREEEVPQKRDSSAK